MRRRYVWSNTANKLIEVPSSRSSLALQVIGDSQEFRVPGTDMVISGKRARREFMKRYGLEEVGNDKEGLRKETEKARMYRDQKETTQLKSTLVEVLRAREFFTGKY